MGTAGTKERAASWSGEQLSASQVDDGWLRARQSWPAVMERHNALRASIAASTCYMASYLTHT